MEVLSRVSFVELWKVKDSVEELLVKDEWVITSEGAAITSKIGSYSWRLDSSMHCIRAEERSFVFAINPQENLFYCCNLSPNVSTDDIAVLETVLDSFAAYEVRPTEEKPSKADKFIDGLNKATSTIVSGMSTTALYLGEKMKETAEKYKSNRAPCENPKPVSEATKRRIEQVKNVTKTTSGIAIAAVDAVSVFTSKAADAILGTPKQEDAHKPASKVKRVAAAVVVSAAEIYEGMIDAFTTVSKHTATAATDVVAHRYGEDVGKVSMDSLSAVGHAANTVVSSTKLTTKAVLKSAAKKTAIGYVSGGNAPSSSST